MKTDSSDLWENNTVPDQNTLVRRTKLNILELEELREHIDLIPFNIEKVYRQAKFRSKKDYNIAKKSINKNFHYSPKNKYSEFEA